MISRRTPASFVVSRIQGCAPLTGKAGSNDNTESLISRKKIPKAWSPSENFLLSGLYPTSKVLEVGKVYSFLLRVRIEAAENGSWTDCHDPIRPISVREVFILFQQISVSGELRKTSLIRRNYVQSNRTYKIAILYKKIL